MTPVESFRGADLLISHEFSNYPTADHERIPIQAIRTEVIKMEVPVSVFPYFVFRSHPEGFMICLN